MVKNYDGDEYRDTSKLDHQPRKFTGVSEKAQYLKPLMSQAEVAAELGVSHATIAEIERAAFRKIRLALMANGIMKDDVI